MIQKDMRTLMFLFFLVQAAATGAFSAAERSNPKSEVRDRSQEDPMPEGRQPRGPTPSPRPGAVARRRTPPPRSGGCIGTGGPRGVIPHSRSEGAAVRRNGMDLTEMVWTSSTVGAPAALCWSSREEIPHAQGKRGQTH